jgi:hypothetical protein
MQLLLITVAPLLGATIFTSDAFGTTTRHRAVTSGGIGIRLIASSPKSTENPSSLSYVIDRLAPGTRLSRSVEVSNTTDANAEVVVYVAGANIVRGLFMFAPGENKDALSNWTTVARCVVDLKPGGTALESITISVPNDAQAGVHCAVLCAAVSAPSPAAGGVELVSRVGVRLYISIGSGGAPMANLTVGSLTAMRSASGDPLVVARLRNIGQVALALTGSLTLAAGPGGLLGGPFPVAVGGVLYPGHSAVETAQIVSQIPRGPWRAELRLTGDGAERSVVAMLTFPRLQVTKVGRPLPYFLILVALFLFVLLAAIASAIFACRQLQERFS